MEEFLVIVIGILIMVLGFALYELGYAQGKGEGRP